MSKFFETSDYLAREIARKQKELEDLQRRQYDAGIREFFWYIEDQMNTDNHDFLDASWKIEFMGKSIELNNYANVWEAMHGLLIDYMDEDEIPYKRGCEE